MAARHGNPGYISFSVSTFSNKAIIPPAPVSFLHELGVKLVKHVH